MEFPSNLKEATPDEMRPSLTHDKCQMSQEKHVHSIEISNLIF